AAGEISRPLPPGARPLARRARRARPCQGGESRRHRLHLRTDPAKTLAARLVPLVLRAHAGVARLGTRPGRSDQAADQDAVAYFGAAARLAHAAAVLAHPPPHAGSARG